MNNRFMRAAAFAAAACLSMSSCAEKTSNNVKLSAAEAISSNSDNMNAAELLEGSYKLTDYKTIDGLDSLDKVVCRSDGSFMGKSYVFDSEGGHYAVFSISSDFSEAKELKLDIPDDAVKADEYDVNYSINHSGDIAALYTMYDNGVRTLPDEYDEDFDYEEFYSNQKSTFGLCFYNTDGSIKSFVNLGELEEYRDPDDDYFFINSIELVNDSSVLMCFSDGALYLCGNDGKLDKLPDYKENVQNPMIYFILGSDNTVYMYYSYYEDENYTKNLCYIVPIDAENKSYGKPLLTIDNNIDSMMDSYMSGYGDYCLLRSDEKDLYGIKSDGTSEKILNWADADASSMSVVSAGNDEFYCWGYGRNKSCAIYKLVPRSIEEVANTQVITIGLLYGGCDPMINSFNRSQSKYRLKKVDYSEKYKLENPEKYKEPENNEEYMKKEADMINYMQMDIISGNAPDLILCYDHNSIKSLGAKGLFTDLYTFMENEPDINRENIVPNYLRAMENKDGHLYSISPSFQIETLAVKSKFMDHENWTIQEMKALYDKSTAEHRFDCTTKMEMFRTLLEGQSSLIDIENGKCSFDSPDFIEMLKFCDQFVEEEDVPGDKDNDYEAIDKYFTDKAKWTAQEKALISYCSGYSSYTKYDTFGGDDYTLVGYPNSDGKGGKLLVSGEFAICETSSKKEGAWEFIKTLFDYEDDNNYFTYGYPILKPNFKNSLDETTKFYDWDENGNRIEVTTIDSKLDNTLYPLTQAERDDLERYILTCDTLLNSMNLEVKNICTEEADAFFHGEKTAEEAAKMIQNRASILVSEKN